MHAATSTSQSNLLQFTASGHLLGFESDGVYVASGDHVLRVEFAGTDGARPVTDQMPAIDGNAEALGRVDYPELWPGISLCYETVSGGIVQSSYLLEPGADVDQIRLRYNASVEVEDGGSLRIGYENGWMNESAPVAWQEIDGRRIPVTIAFTLCDSSTNNSMVGFSLGQYDSAYPLMIDPTLSWNTFIGAAASTDAPFAIAVDRSGNVYVAGESSATWGSPVNAYSGSEDVFVAKLNSRGVLQWNTFMGSIYGDDGRGISVDDSGDVYIAGYSVATWGSPVNPFIVGAGGYPHSDAFVAKLNNSGEVQWNTFIGSAYSEYAYSITVDDNGNVYVAGKSGFWGSPVNAYAGDLDAFVAKLDSDGVMLWNTFIGSADDDSAWAIAVDCSGDVYVAGTSEATWGSPVNAYAGGVDAFIAKLNSGGVLLWNTFMGPVFFDTGLAIAVDCSGNVYVAGTSEATWGSPVNAYAGTRDVFAAKLNSSGVMQWNTFMGSGFHDYIGGLALDDSGNVYLAGKSDATWGSPLNAHVVGSNSDGFAAKLNSNGGLQWNTFMGSTGHDGSTGIAVDSSGNIYVAGWSTATWGPPLNAYLLNDAFVAKLSAPITTPAINLLLLLE